MISAQQAADQFARVVAHLEGKHGRAIAQTAGQELRSRYQGGPAVLHERHEFLFKDGARAVLTRPPGGPWTSEAGGAAVE